jgi:hypothetical protein|tara:strand:+ start:94 stop:576 length:483 start_codon:yes stop_codon:yes gene_type:complete
MEGRQTLVDEDFEVPQGLVNEKFRLRMLTIHDLVKDYEAVMSSAEHLKEAYSAIWDSDWPEGLTNEEDLIGLWRHQMEFVLHYSVAYTIMSPDESLCLGCLYINPCRKMGYDAEVSMWGRSSELVNNLDSELHSCIKKWIDEAWPFSRTTYPVRPITVES